MWQQRPRTALLVAHSLAALASAAQLPRDVSALRSTRRGRYVLAHMPPSAAAVRYAGQVLAWYAASQRRPAGILLGHLVVVAGWSFGLGDWARRTTAWRQRTVANGDRSPRPTASNGTASARACALSAP
jgi:hypothetical protein